MEKCPACGSGNIFKIIDQDRYAINRCKRCGLTFASPLPDDVVLAEFYQGFLFNLPEKREIEAQIKKRKRELIRLFNIKPGDKGRNFLDFGGGTGSAYKAARELNLNVYYHDLDEKAKAFVKREYGLTDEFIVDAIDETGQRFDYVFSDNVIEHLKNPVAYVKAMRDILNKDGEIIIKTPHGGNTEIFFYPMVSIKEYFLRALKYNPPAVAVKAYFRRFWHCDPPRHLFSFSAPNLKIIATLAGFDESEINISYYRLPLWKYSISEIFVNFRKYHSLRSMLLRVIVLPVLPFEILSKILQLVLSKVNILSPAGVILHLKKTS